MARREGGEGNDASVVERQLPSLGGAGGGFVTSPGNAVAVSGPSQTDPRAIPQNISVPSRLRRLLFAPVKFFWGIILCQSVLGALAVVGWTYRLMQRSVLKQWWKLSVSSAKAGSFAAFVASNARTGEHVHWPNWFLAQNFRGTICRREGSETHSKQQRQIQGSPLRMIQPTPNPTPEGNWPSASERCSPPSAGQGVGSENRYDRGDSVSPSRSFGRYPWTILKALGQSLWMNVRLGVQGVFNTWVLTLPACVLMLFGWYDGWNNSFNKGYEQFLVGPGISWLGIMLFIAAMIYSPMAQARQAVTGKWRSFYQFRLVWSLVRRRWLACFGLAMLYALCSVPMLILGSIVMFLPNINPKLADLTPAQTIQVLNTYFFWSALFVFPAFVLLRLVAAHIYGTALLKAVQTGAVLQDALAESEWQTLHRLELLQVQPPRVRHPVLRIVTWAGTRAGRITFGFLTGLIWFVFIVQLYITQFFNYRGAQIWLSQPLVHLPWFHHMPAALKNPWGDFLAAAAIVFFAWRLKRLVNWLKSLRRS